MIKKRPLDYRNDIKKCKEKLYAHMENDDYVSPQMLDEALAVINAQNGYIKWLEKEHGDWLNNI